MPLFNQLPNLCYSCKGDIWKLFAEFLTQLGTVNERFVKLLPTKLDGCEAVILPEDTMLSGFVPLLGAPFTSMFAQPPYDKVFFLKKTIIKHHSNLYLSILTKGNCEILFTHYPYTIFR